MTSTRRVIQEILEPAGRVWDLPGAGKLLAVGGGMLAWLSQEALAGIVALLFLASLVDYLIGRRLAIERDTYCSDTARLGWLSKACGILIVLLVYAADWWALTHSPVHLGGWPALAIGFALLLAEIDSIDRHRRSAGGAAIPGWDRLMGAMEEISQRLTGGGPSGREE